ncbi:MAG: alpha/beta hydrolase [Chloroflexota bacterium]
MAASISDSVTVQDVEYQRLGAQPRLARIYQPSGPGPFPALVHVHGGAWVNGDRTNDGAMNRLLAASGVLVAALDFRQPPEAGYPASLSDINLGIRWLKANAGQFGGASSVGGIGISSGGHQVVLSALRPRDPRYAALPLPGHSQIDARLSYVVACWPVIDPFYRYQEVAQKLHRDEMISAHQRYWGSDEAMQEGTPIRALEHDAAVDMPPVLLLQREGDPVHPLPMQEHFVAAYRQRGGDIRMEMFSGVAERFAPSEDVPETMRVMDLITTFIQQQAG